MYYRTVKKHNGAYSGLICDRHPFACADISGNEGYNAINGTVNFFATPAGIVVSSEIFNLPYDESTSKVSQIYGFHINNVGKCKAGDKLPNLQNESSEDSEYVEDIKYSGDLPPLFGNRGYAWSAVLTDRFSPEDLLGHTLCISSGTDMCGTDADNKSVRIAGGIINKT